MEFAIAVFLGAWLCAAGVMGYVKLKKEYDKEENAQ